MFTSKGIITFVIILLIGILVTVAFIGFEYLKYRFKARKDYKRQLKVKEKCAQLAEMVKDVLK